MINTLYSRDLRRWRVTLRLESTTEIYTNSKAMLQILVRDILSDPLFDRKVELSVCNAFSCPFDHVGPIDLFTQISLNIYKITIHELESPS